MTTRKGRNRIHWPTILIESFLIVFSISLAFTFNQWRDHQKQNTQRNMALENFHAELYQNKQNVVGWLPYHTSVRDNIRKAIADEGYRKTLVTSYGLQFRLLAPKGLYRGLPLRTTAWETAKNANIVLLLDFETTYALSDIYQLQRMGVSSTLEGIIKLIYDRASYDPGQIETTLLMLEAAYSELVSQEDYLIHSYADVIPRLWPAKSGLQ